MNAAFRMRNHTLSWLLRSGLLLLVLLAPAMGIAQQSTYMITYGTDSNTDEGDDDFVQVLFLRLPETLKDSVYLRVFDADCGGQHDARYRGEFNTTTTFSLYGGPGAYTTAGLKSATPSATARHTGTQLAQLALGEDNFKDNQWVNLSVIAPNQGELVDEYYYLKLVVEGGPGDDGNIFLVEPSRVPQRNLMPDGAELFTYAPTIRLPNPGVFAEMRFMVPESVREITVHGFDVTGATIGVETAFRSNLPVQTGGQNEWATSSVELDRIEVGRLCALRFEGGAEMPNDGGFYVTDDSGNLLPIELPIYIQRPNTPPIPVINTELLADCKTVLFDGSQTTDPDGDALQFTWDFGDSATGSGSRTAHTYRSPGTYQVRSIIEEASGRVNNAVLQEMTVLVNSPPAAEAGADITCTPGRELTFDGGASSDADGQVVAYYWDFGDGYKAQGPAVTHRYEKPDFYTVTLRVEDNSGTPCNFDTDELEVWVNAAPVVEIGEDIIASVDESITLSGANSQDSDGSITSFVWDMGDGTTLEGMEITHAYAAPGTYDVTLEIADNSGARNNTAGDRLQVFVNDPPVADAGPDHRVATDEVITFDGAGSSDNDNSLIRYTWDFGDGSSKENGMVTRHSYTDPGRYRAVLEVQDDSRSTTDTDTDSTLVIINFPPVAEAGEDQWVTASDVQFDGSASSDEDGVITAYHWEFGDGYTGEGPQPVHVFANPGVYTVTLTVTDDSETSTESTSDQMQVIVNHLPIADAGPDVIGAPGVDLTFDGSGSFDPDGSVESYEWEFGDGESGTGVSAMHAFKNPGKYTVLLTVRDNTGHSSALSYDQAEVIVNQAPVAEAGLEVRVAPGDEVKLNGGRSYDPDGEIVAYAWDFSDDHETVEKKKATRVFEEPGIYVATLTVTDDAKVDNSTTQDRVLIKVNHQPAANAGEDVHTSSRTVTLDGGASNDADGDRLFFTWDPGDGGKPLKGKTVQHTYKRGGSYPVILTVDDGTGLDNATATSSITVQINEAPVAEAGEDITVCAGEVVIFDGGASVDPEGGLLKYYWDFGDGSTMMGVNPTKIYDTGGVYLVTLRVEDDSGLEEGSSSTDQIVVRVAESPVAAAGEDQTVCANTTVQFDGSKSTDVDGLVNSYQWDFGDGGTGGGPTPTHVYTSPGTYRVTLIITGDRIGDCNNTGTDDMLVTVYEAPFAVFESVTQAGLGEALTLDASASTGGGAEIAEYAWDFGDGQSAQGEIVEHTFEKPGNYRVRLTVRSNTDTDCNQTTTQNLVFINAAPVAQAGEAILAGTNQVVTFNGMGSKDPDGAITMYEWDFGDGATGVGVQPRHQYDQAGEYEVVLHVRDNTQLSNNYDYDTLLVTVNDAPQPIITADEVVCAQTPVTFSAAATMDDDASGLSYSWVFGDGGTMTGEEVSHTFNSPGRYEVTLLVDDGRGVGNSRAQTTMTVTVNDPPIPDPGHSRIVSPGEDVVFDGSESRDPDGEIVQWRWDFGDGMTAPDAETVHAYSTPGVYTVTLTITDDSGTPCGTQEKAIEVRVNTPPAADAGGDREAFAGGAHDAVVFDASGSSDPDNDPLTFSWDFGDGNTANGPKVMHAYDEPGVYTVRLRVDDGTKTTAGEAWDEITVTVNARE